MYRTTLCLILVCLGGCRTAARTNPAPSEQRFQCWFELDQDKVHFVVWNTDPAPIKLRIVTAQTMGRTIDLRGDDPPTMAFSPCLERFSYDEQIVKPDGRWRHTFKDQPINPNESTEYSITVRVGKKTFLRSFRIQGEDFVELEKRMQAVWKTEASKLNASPSAPSSPKTP